MKTFFVSSWTVLLFLLAAGNYLHADPPALPSSGGLAQVLQPFVDRQTIVGAVVLVATSDKVLDLEAVGFADVAAQRPMRTDDLFAIASMSKPLAGTCLMMMIDAGKVGLDDPVEKFVPEFRDVMVADSHDPAHTPHKPHRPIIVRDILTHTSGLVYSAPEERPALDGHPLRESVVLCAHTPLLFEPGTRFGYSSAGINTAALIVQITSGMPYEQFLQERLLTPLGMQDTTFWPTATQLERQAKFYRENKTKDGLEEVRTARFHYPLDDRTHRFPIPGSGLFSTATDMCRFCQMILNDGTYQGKTYLPPAVVREMTSRQTPADIPNNYGFGWEVNADRTTIGHGGSYHTFMKIYPALNLILISLQQFEGAWPQKEGEAIVPALERAMRQKFAPPKP